VYKDYPPVLGGIEKHIQQLCHLQSRSGRIAPGVLVTAPGLRTERIDDDGVPVVKSARLATIASTPLSLSLVAELARTPADIAHLHVPNPPGELAQLLVGRAPRLVITYHSDVIRQLGLLRFYQPLLRRLLRRADRIIVSSPAYLLGSRHLAPYRDKSRIVPFGVDLARFQPVSPTMTSAIRDRFPVPIVLFVGRFRYYKGLEYLVEAARSVEATFLLVGSGPLEREIRRRVADAGIEGRVRLVGDVSEADLPAYYGAADVFVLPASERSEAFGISAIEAMAAGLPVVTTELGTGTTFVNRHGETGLVVPARDSAALAMAVRRLLADDGLRRRMAAAARRRAVAEFGQESMLARTLQVYDEVLALGKRP
jgi:rhamnosyl/mannosyltransferase